MMRIVSLLASATEIVCALGFGDRLVGRSHECDFPAQISSLPQGSQPSFPVSDSSRAIDLAVKERLAKALSIYDVDPAVLAALAPDVVITQTQCKVCAVSPEDVERAMQDWTKRSTRVVAVEPHALSDVQDDIRRIASALDAPERGERLVESLSVRFASISSQAPTDTRPTLSCVEWIEPLMTAGNWMPELVEIAGGRQIMGEAGRHSPFISWDDLLAADPDVLLVSPCGFDVSRTLSEMSLLEAQPGWRDLRAVRSGRVFVADGNAYFHRPGPRLVESAEILQSMLFADVDEGPGFVRHAR